MIIIPADFASQSQVPANKLADSILTVQRDLQTGLVDVEFPGVSTQTLLFARGQLAAVYRLGETVARLNPAAWLESLDESSSEVHIRSLALTLQDVRIFKILIEQQDGIELRTRETTSLDKQFSECAGGSEPALAQVRWPNATALIVFPGEGVAPLYSLMISAEQIRHSPGDLKMIYDWPEDFESVHIFSSESHTQAWTEYLLHQAFTGLVAGLLVKVDKLIGRLLLNQIIRDINFKATAHDWNLSLNTHGVDDQTIFTSPQAEADVYSRLLEALFHQFEGVLGNAMLEMLVGEAVHKLPAPCRQVLKQYLPISNLAR